MPSPIAHCSLALALRPALERPLARAPRRGRTLFSLALLAALLAPDLDILADPLLGRPWFENHGGPAHSLIAGVLFGVPFAAVCRAVVPLRPGRLWLIGAGAYCSHVLMDACTRGRGVALLWPFSSDRFALPVPLFVGVHHGPGELGRWDLHAAMALSELAFAALVWLAARWLRPARRTPPRTHHRTLAIAPPEGA